MEDIVSASVQSLTDIYNASIVFLMLLCTAAVFFVSLFQAPKTNIDSLRCYFEPAQ